MELLGRGLLVLWEFFICFNDAIYNKKYMSNVYNKFILVLFIIIFLINIGGYMSKIFHNGEYYTEEEMKRIVLDYASSVLSKKNDRHLQMQHLFPSDLNENSKILDYGCGMGVISKLFSEKYGSFIDAVDISENELKKAKIAFGDNEKINFMLLNEFTFPEKKYDMVFSSQVIEHVHNPGNYLERINYMLKDDKYLLIGLPNIVNLNYIVNLLFFSKKRMNKYAKNMSQNYNKANDHINGWDPLHFITLVTSCGFEFIDYLPTEGTPITDVFNKIPIIGKYLYRIPLQSRLSYTMFFIFKKTKYIKIGNND